MILYIGGKGNMMADTLKLKEEDTIRVSEGNLRETAISLFEKMGVPKDDCRLAADAMVTADLRGVSSHGVSNILQKYVLAYQKGLNNPRPQMRILRQSPATASIDCDRGLGIIIAPKAMEIAIEKAKNVGLGMVTMMNGRHMGMASYHAMIALKHDMIGMCMTSIGPGMPPTFGAEPRLGTNPIAVAAPADKEAPFVFDAATTVIAMNKLLLARRSGIKLSPGWVADANGTPIMEEVDPPEPNSTMLLPLGSTREMGSHKGYGLACVVDIFSGILTGGGYGAFAGDSSTGAIGGARCNHCVVAYNIESFMEVAQFKKTMDEWLVMLKSTKPAPGHDRVYYPGLLEAECEIEYRAKGIPLHTEVVGWIRGICNKFDIDCYV
jgi:LDH2 family malate/lactate/ureidoglycolate dehydrogenase